MSLGAVDWLPVQLWVTAVFSGKSGYQIHKSWEEKKKSKDQGEKKYCRLTPPNLSAISKTRPSRTPCALNTAPKPHKSAEKQLIARQACNVRPREHSVHGHGFLSVPQFDSQSLSGRNRYAIMNISQPVSSSVDRVEFTFLTKDEIHSISVKKIENDNTFDTLLNPVRGGLYDPALGSWGDSMYDLSCHLCYPSADDKLG